MAGLPEKECAACGAFFTPRRNMQVYCEQCREATGGRGVRMKIRYDRASEGVARRFGNLDMVLVAFTCRQCGKGFEYYVCRENAGTTHKDFGSAKCSSMHRIAQTACAWCGKKMTDMEDVRDTNGHIWYCSDDCRGRAAWKEARQSGEIGICPVCGEEFLNKGHKKTFCSRGCYLANIQAARATGHTVQCRVCGEPVKVKYNPTTARMQRKAAAVWCSTCRQKDIEEAAESYKLRENKRKAAEMKAGEVKFLMENGLCTVYTTSYMKCERMQTGVRVSPKGVQYRNSKVVCCPKFKAKLKYCSPEQFTGAEAAESKAEGSIKTAG